MSRLGKLRKKVNFETNVPRCETCVHYRARQVYLRNSLPRVSSILCVLNEFTTRPNAICDLWKGEDGTTLQSERTS